VVTRFQVAAWAVGVTIRMSVMTSSQSLMPARA
jgi:hypothetical protein